MCVCVCLSLWAYHVLALDQHEHPGMLIISVNLEASGSEIDIICLFLIHFNFPSLSSNGSALKKTQSKTNKHHLIPQPICCQPPCATHT